MKPYRSTSAPSTSSQSSRPPANSDSFFKLSRCWGKELTDLGAKEKGARRSTFSLQRKAIVSKCANGVKRLAAETAKEHKGKKIGEGGGHTGRYRLLLRELLELAPVAHRKNALHWCYRQIHRAISPFEIRVRDRAS